MGTGLIYAAIVAAWAAYLVPLWLRRHDEAAAARSVDRFSTAMRVLARRQPGLPTSESGVIAPPPRSAVVPGSSRAAAVARTSAATRRRRILVALLVLTSAVAGLAAVELVPWWALAVPGGLVVAFLFLSSLLARRARRSRDLRSTPVVDAEAQGPDASVDAPMGSPPTAPDAGAWDGAGAASHLVVRTRTETTGMAGSASASEAAGDNPMWDPVHVPLPTYVTKAKAPRTVRTVELGEPGTWTSGRLPEAEMLNRPADAPERLLDETEPPPADEQQNVDSSDDAEHRRAVGD